MGTLEVPTSFSSKTPYACHQQANCTHFQAFTSFNYQSPLSFQVLFYTCFQVVLLLLWTTILTRAVCVFGLMGEAESVQHVG